MTFAIWFDTMMGLGAAGFLAWLVWSLFFDIYDHLMQQRTRRRNQQFDARVGRDVWKDVRGVTK
jgi:hypothetical protein